MKGNVSMEVIAFIATIAAGYLGSALLGATMNWPDAGAITAIAVMGCFILHEIRTLKRPENTDHPDS